MRRRRSYARSGDLAAVAEVEVVIVARGGGSLADLLCFCDETLCRTVALLGVPVIASVGHHTDRTLLDDVAAVSCSTPTHAAEAAVGVDCAAGGLASRPPGARPRQRRAAASTIAERARRLRDHGRRAVLARARLLATLSRAPADHLERQRARLHQQLREIARRLAAAGRLRARASPQRRALVLQRKAASSLAGLPRAASARARRSSALALAGHDPQRTLERGYVARSIAATASRSTSAAAATRRASASCGCASPTASCAAEVERAMSEPEPPAPSTGRRPHRRPRPTRPRRRASRRSSAAWTPARRASTRRSSCVSEGKALIELCADQLRGRGRRARGAAARRARRAGSKARPRG